MTTIRATVSGHPTVGDSARSPPQRRSYRRPFRWAMDEAADHLSGDRSNIRMRESTPFVRDAGRTYGERWR